MIHSGKKKPNKEIILFKMIFVKWHGQRPLDRSRGAIQNVLYVTLISLKFKKNKAMKLICF
jgi:hypothetical protein